MRLITAEAQRQAHIAEILGHVVIEGFGALQIAVHALGQLFGFGPDFGRGRAAVFFQAGIPAANLLPAFERGELNVRTVVVGVVPLPFLFFVLGLVLIFALQMRTGPVVNAAAVGLSDGGIFSRLALELQGSSGRNIDVERFIEIDVRVVEFIFRPELTGSQRSVRDRDQVVFQNFTRTQAGHGDVLLAVIGVDRRLVFDRGAQVLLCVLAGLDDGAVGFEHAHVSDVDALVGRVVAFLQLPPLLHAGFALHPDSRDSFFASGAVGFEAIGRMHLLDDKRLLRIVVRLGVRLFLRLGVGSGLGSSRRRRFSRSRTGLLRGRASSQQQSKNETAENEKAQIAHR